MLISLDKAKQHLNVEKDFHDDDEYILGLISVAEAAVEKHVAEKFESIAEKNGGELPTPILQAALLLIGNLYQNREPVGTRERELPYNYQYLVDLYRNYNN